MVSFEFLRCIIAEKVPCVGRKDDHDEDVVPRIPNDCFFGFLMPHLDALGLVEMVRITKVHFKCKTKAVNLV